METRGRLKAGALCPGGPRSGSAAMRWAAPTTVETASCADIHARGDDSLYGAGSMRSTVPSAAVLPNERSVAT
jgi:hypothetical protein